MSRIYTNFDYPLLALGFRVFFALAGVSALILMVFWSAFFKGTLTQETYFTTHYWHGHEMLVGYAVAVIAGFLLTAVQDWTGKTISGKPLAQLALLWIYGRVVPFYEGLLPDILIALIDFAFLPVLAYWSAKLLWQARHYKPLIFVGLLLLLSIGNALIHSELLGWQTHTALIGIQLIMATLIVMILVIAGRILPFFTDRGLSATLVLKNPVLDIAAIISAVLIFALPIFGVTGTSLALVATLATLANTIRVYSWYNQKIWYQPLLWVLYVGYGWIIVGFLLTALAAYAVVSPSVALHAFTIGGIGIMTVGMMARVSLTQTGKVGRASNTTVVAFILLNLAVVFRVLLAAVVPAWANHLIYLSMLLWLAAFSLFVLAYLPVWSSKSSET